MTTLREQAAIAAMQRLISFAQQCKEPSAMAATAATWAVDYANALLAALEQAAPKPPADATGLTCTAVERELIEAMVRWDGTGWGANGFERRENVYIAHEKVLAERRAGKEAKETKP